MSVVKKLEFPDAKFDLYFLGYDSPSALSHGNSVFDREGLIELTHNYGTEDDPEYKVNTGNAEPHRGFGHTCISVVRVKLLLAQFRAPSLIRYRQDNIQAACQRLEDAGYKFQKKLTDGRMRNIAFALDPDGYCTQLLRSTPCSSICRRSTDGILQGSRLLAASSSKRRRVARRPMCPRT